MNIGLGSEEKKLTMETTTESKIQQIEIAKDDKLNLKTSNAYHEQGLKQAGISFNFSLVAGALGFIILLIAIFILRENQSYVGVVAGIIMESIATIFFKITNDTAKARTAYFDKLRDDTKHENSIELCNSIEDKQIKDKLKVKLALYFAGLDESKICNNTIEVCYTKAESE